MNLPSIQEQMAQNQLADTNLRFAKLNDTQRRIEEKLDLIIETLVKPEQVFDKLKDTPKGTSKK